MIVASMVITLGLSTCFSSSGDRSLIILLIDGVIGYSSLAAMIVTVVIIIGSYVIFADSLTNILGPAIAKNLSKILTATSQVSSL